MDKKHHRQRALGPTLALGIQRHGQRQIAHQLQAVARADDDRVHAGQRQALQLGLAGEQEAGLARRAVVEVEARRTRVHREGHGPNPVVQRPACHLDVAVGQPRQVVQVALDRGVHDVPPTAGVRARHGLDVLVLRMDQDAVDVGQVGFRQQLFGTRLQVHGFQRACVPPPAVQHVAARGGLVETGRMGRHRVLGLDAHPLTPTVGGVRLQVEMAGVGRHRHGEPHPVVVVGREAGEPRVFLHERPLASPDMDPVDIVPLAIAPVVDADQHVFRHPGADPLDPRGDLVDRRQVADLICCEINTVDVPILVAVRVLGVENVAVRVGPGERVNAAVSVPGDRTGIGG